MRQVNWLVLIVTAIAIAVGGTGAFFLRDYQLQRTAQSYWDRALALEANGDGKQAAAYLFRYARFCPNDGEVRVKLARIYDDNSQTSEEKWRTAELYYEAIGFAKDEDRLSLRRRLAELLLATNRLPSAKAQALEIRALLRGDRDDADAGRDDPVAERVMAEVLYRQYVMGVIGPEQVAGETIGEVVARGASIKSSGDSLGRDFGSYVSQPAGVVARRANLWTTRARRRGRPNYGGTS